MGGSLRLTRRFMLPAFIALALAAPAQAGTLSNPIDPKQQTALHFGDRSHWLQPWRAYLDTFPATHLLGAIGINFNHVKAEDAEATAQLLGQSGFARARVEFGWDSMDYAEPWKLKNPGRIHTFVGALKRHGIRPLILLNANHGIPGPAEFFDAVLTAPARSGDRTVLLDPTTAARVVPHKTGLNSSSPRRAADVIFTSVAPDGRATLSRPLPRDLAAGPHPAATLRFAPFGPPRLADGSPNPIFEETLNGWLTYATAVTREVREVMGSDAFDVEIWNELSFGSDFLYHWRYYDPVREEGEGDVTAEILRRTVAHLRDPRSGVSGVGIGNGFSNQRPWESGTTSPPGLTAIDKHPYYGLKSFPDDQVVDGISPIDALGRTSFVEGLKDGGGLLRRDHFVPRYDSYFPEYILSAIQTEHLVRDISPITTDLRGTAHGRYTRPGEAPPPAVWITEANMDPTKVGLSGAAAEHMQAKSALRYYTAFAAKGVSAIHLYGVNGGNLALVKGGDPTGGEAPTAVRRLVQGFAGAQPLQQTHPLSLLEISDSHDHKQFEGGGDAGHPPLYDRDVVAFFPFQLSEGAYVAPTYVMTRNVAKDLAPAPFRLKIGGLDPTHVRASATDPLTGETVPVKVVSREADGVVVELPLTDSPRLLRLEGPRAQVRTSISLRAKRRTVLRRGTQRFRGTAQSTRRACSRRVVVVLKRKRGSGWKRVKVLRVSRSRAGRFSALARRLKPGRYRAQAVTRARDCGRGRSRAVRFSAR